MSNFTLVTSFVLKHVFVTVPVIASGMVVLPFVLPFIRKESEQLPKAFRWYDNHEVHLKDINNLGDDIDGLMGPRKYRIKIGALRADGSDNPNFGYFKRLWHRYNWLAIRNPAYYFQHAVVGHRMTYSVIVTSEHSDLYPNGPFAALLAQTTAENVASLYSKKEADGHVIDGIIEKKVASLRTRMGPMAQASNPVLEELIAAHYSVNERDRGREGWYFTKFHDMDTDKDFFEFYGVFRITKTRQLRLRLGHKVRDPRRRSEGYIAPTDLSILFPKVGE